MVEYFVNKDLGKKAMLIFWDADTIKVTIGMFDTKFFKTYDKARKYLTDKRFTETNGLEFRRMK